MLSPSNDPVSDTNAVDHPVHEQPAMVLETEESRSLADNGIETHVILSEPLPGEHNLLSNQVSDVKKCDNLLLVVDQVSNSSRIKDGEPMRCAKTKGQLKKQLRRKRMQSAKNLISANCMNGKIAMSDSESAFPSSQSSVICAMDVFQSKVSSMPNVELVISN